MRSSRVRALRDDTQTRGTNSIPRQSYSGLSLIATHFELETTPLTTTSDKCDATRRLRAKRLRRAVTLALSAIVFASGSASPAPPPELGELKGKVVWVDFWASWCVPCRHSFPWMNKMQQKYGGQGLQIIGVNLDNDRKAADAFLDATPAAFTLKFDPAGALARKYDVQAMPSSFLLDASGDVIAKHFGFKLAEVDQYEAQIRAALSSH